MIKVTDISTCGWDMAIMGMRAPHKSYAKSDSVYKDGVYQLGPNDIDLALRLCKAGTEHRKFLRMIHCQMKITAPLYFFKEQETYKVGTTSDSESTMHKIAAKEFTLDDFSHEHLSDFSSHPESVQDPLTILYSTIKTLNSCRECYIKEKDNFFWWQMIQLLPSSYNQTRFFDCSMETLLNICHQRKSHKLDEWREFVKIVLKEVPYLEAFYNSAYGG